MGLGWILGLLIGGMETTSAGGLEPPSVVFVHGWLVNGVNGECNGYGFDFLISIFIYLIIYVYSYLFGLSCFLYCCFIYYVLYNFEFGVLITWRLRRLLNISLSIVLFVHFYHSYYNTRICNLNRIAIQPVLQLELSIRNQTKL